MNYTTNGIQSQMLSTQRPVVPGRRLMWDSHPHCRDDVQSSPLTCGETHTAHVADASAPNREMCVRTESGGCECRGVKRLRAELYLNLELVRTAPSQRILVTRLSSLTVMALSPLISPAQIVAQLTIGVKSTPRFCEFHSKCVETLDCWRLRCQRFRSLQCGAGAAASADSPRSPGRGYRV